MKIHSPYQRKRARIEIIPLIDIIFFLLATFVMVSMSMVKNQGISVNLPVASTGKAVERSLAKTVTIEESGNVFLDQERMSVPDVVNRLKELKRQDAELAVIINGDEAADFGIVVKILDELRKSGIIKVAIQTRSVES